MRKLLIVLLFSALPLLGQSTEPVTGYCDTGAIRASVSGLNSTNYLLGIIPGCTISVYQHGTTTLAPTIYADSNNTPLANPFTAVVSGSPNPGAWIFWAPVGACYDVVASGTGYTTPLTVTEVCLATGGGGGGTVTICPTPLTTGVIPLATGPAQLCDTQGPLSESGSPVGLTYAGGGGITVNDRSGNAGLVAFGAGTPHAVTTFGGFQGPAAYVTPYWMTLPDDVPTGTQCLQGSNSAGTVTTAWGACGGGGGGTPSPPIWSIQFNNPLGSFDGRQYFTFEGGRFADDFLIAGHATFDSPTYGAAFEIKAYGTPNTGGLSAGDRAVVGKFTGTDQLGAISFNTVSLVSGGSGNSVGDNCTFPGGDANATLLITEVDGSGAVTAWQMVSGGSGYSAGNETLTGCSGTGPTMDVGSVSDGMGGSAYGGYFIGLASSRAEADSNIGTGIFASGGSGTHRNYDAFLRGNVSDTNHVGLFITSANSFTEPTGHYGIYQESQPASSTTNYFGDPTTFANGITAVTVSTATNCTSSASPAVCGSAAAGSVVIAASGTSVVVNTTAVTANSQIFVQKDNSLGTKLSVTCNTGFLAAPPEVTARTAGTSFTISISAGLATNPVCFSYQVVN